MANFFSKLFNKLTGRSEVDWDELEADLVSADLGIRFSLKLVDELKKNGKIKPEEIIDATKGYILKKLPAPSAPLQVQESGKPTVIMMVGVNGTGKTTSSAKLAKYLTNKGHSVLLVAADTFRAAAVEQLDSWAQKYNLPIFKGRPNQDPASVCYEAHTKAIAEKIDFLICDTAGRLHTRHNLMEELSKIRRTIAKQDETAPHHAWLVVDATTGANALAQAKQFNRATSLDGVVITKLDGSGKGGVALSIFEEINIAPTFIGTGEGVDDFAVFRPDVYVNSLL